MSNLSTDIGTLTTKVSTVELTAEGLTAEVSSVRDNVSGLDTDIGTLTTKVSTVELTADGLEVMVTEAQGTADSAYKLGWLSLQ